MSRWGVSGSTSTRPVQAHPLVVLHHSTGPLWTPFYDAAGRRRSRSSPPTCRATGAPSARATPAHPRDLAVLLLQLLDELDLGPVAPRRPRASGVGSRPRWRSMAQRRLARLTLVGAAGHQAARRHDPRPDDGRVDRLRRGAASATRPPMSRCSARLTPSQDIIDLWDYSREMTARLTWKPWMWSRAAAHAARGRRDTVAGGLGRARPRSCPLDCGAAVRRAAAGRPPRDRRARGPRRRPRAARGAGRADRRVRSDREGDRCSSATSPSVRTRTGARSGTSTAVRRSTSAQQRYVQPELGAELYNRYFDEKIYIEEMGFDGVMLNSHHSTPFCMGGGPMNLEAADPGPDHREAQDRAARQRAADLGRPAVAGRGAGRRST